ncbi:MAG: thiamine pyrophosphate-binding protein [Rhodospirillaceae bacterium]|jgi:thiamine pyrophosphate-dependent acetolactate synthase large subunit-like protein|nr:thiamine pyrophosphate-binding protein [Rhodospirillaceae bacterium]MBT5938324.1 thiamine pyrophosphate-binding protein [Rhodospirillaceae bacterium]MBT7266930.1 thiamine pyrophosphate-binding protein [Rhodospirillaceae bacterium]
MTKNHNKTWGSDVLASALRETGVPYLVINPGGSYRGLHDSVVNYLGNQSPQLIMCLHEEYAASIAHGYAMVTGEPLAVAVHSNVGIMHASMAVFNAWCGRIPLILISANGPVDAAERRPWIDWIHTSADHGAMVRNYTKWDDQPASIPAAIEAIRRAAIVTRTQPTAPVMINFDTSLQENEIDAAPELPAPSRYAVPAPTIPSTADIRSLVSMIEQAKAPVILSGRLSRTDTSWQNRIDFAERIGARVFTSVGVGASFPTNHALHADEIGFAFSESTRPIIEAADLIIGLEWRDLGGTLKTEWPTGENLPQVINCSMDHQIANGWSMDYYSLAPADIHVATTADTLVEALLEKLPETGESTKEGYELSSQSGIATGLEEGPLRMANIVSCFNQIAEDYKTCLINRPIRWPTNSNNFDHPLSYLGDNGGGGLGAGPGIAVGAALALRDHFPERLPIAILGDGDFMMASNALWTAAKYDLPLLILIANNHTYFADEVLQEKVAEQRGRPVENKTIGISIDEPQPDIVNLARSLGFDAEGPLMDHNSLEQSFQQAAKSVSEGKRVLLDVSIEQENFDIFPERVTNKK